MYVCMYVVRSPYLPRVTPMLTCRSSSISGVCSADIKAAQQSEDRKCLVHTSMHCMCVRAYRA